MPIHIYRNETEYEIFETFNIILKENDIATIESDKHDFKILITFKSDESGKRSFEYKFSEEHECPFLYFKNWDNQKTASKEILPIAQVTKKEINLESNIDTETLGKLGLQVFVQRTTEVINVTLQFTFEAQKDI